MATATISNAPVYSSLASDPDLTDLVDLFVSEIPERVTSMEARARESDWEGLRRLAHQIKGAVGSYGFSDVTPYAARLERSLNDSQPEDIVLRQLEDLLTICRRMQSGTPE